jgi:4-amino-4-deoxy-L-arabinose transferase-like glycosyltransferase
MGRSGRGSWADSGWFTGVVLALPFVITTAVLRGLTVTLPIFHGSDERVYHLPTIRRFASQLPFPDLVHYGAAQTPLFHLLMAYVGKVIGYQLWRLRLVEVLISYGLAWAVFGLLHRRLGLRRLEALALALVFIFSPYVFGASFRVVTDNLTMLFVVLAVERLETFRTTRALGAYLVACLYIALAILTRQSAAFMLPMAAVYALMARLDRRRLGLSLGGLALAAAPAGTLFLLWHGLVPKGGNPASCGLCASQGVAHGVLSVQTLELTLAALALYGVVLFSPQALELLMHHRTRLRSRVRSRPSWLYAAGGAAILGIVLLAVWPARPGPVGHSAGLIWNAAGRLPAIHGSSLAFWVLVPLAGVVGVTRLRIGPRPQLVAAFLGFFLLGALAIRLPWQKYVDPFVLLALLFTVRRAELAGPRQRLGAAAVVVGSIAYAISLAS